MTVHVRIHLRRRPGRPIGPASALHIPGRDAARLLDACARVGIDPSGRIHDLDGGFLIRLPRPTAEPVPGATRLRELAQNLYVPVDADLVPALLDDEAAGMVRDGGLVLLPAGPALRFDPTRPVRLSTLLHVERPQRRNWQPMPEPRPIAERIVEISREIPETPPEELYRALEDDVRHPDRPRSRPERAADDAMEEADIGEATGAGRIRTAASGLGNAIRGLAGRARSLRDKAQWGMLDHSSLVKKLLREFRQGNMDRALQHSFSMREADSRASRVVSWGFRLPFHRAIYSLRDLLGGPERGGVAGIWQARPDLMHELREEYRKAALRAIQAGDFRRAAYIYGVLLDDHRAAAQALQRGGLHHDASILYLKKLNDRPAAAHAFEAAGLVDRAIALYSELGLHETAGDLLRRIGDEEGARSAYFRAVGVARSAHPPDFLEAGRIADRKMALPEAAVNYYAQGWATRPSANAIACSLEMIRILASRVESAYLLGLLDEADEYFDGIGSERDAGLFYNAIVGAAAAVPEIAEEVHDRARSGVARVLRRQVEAGRPASASIHSLFPATSGIWTPAFLRDAQFAATTATTHDRPAEPEPETRGNRHPQGPGIQVGRGTVAAACQASITHRVFLGFSDGRVLAFDPWPNRVVPVGMVKGAIAAIAASPEGDVVVVLRQTEQGATLTTFLARPDGTYRPPRPDILSSRSPTWLTPILASEPSWFIGLGSDRDLMILDAAGGLPMAYSSFSEVTAYSEEPAPGCALLLPGESGFTILTHAGPRWVLLDPEGHALARSGPAFRPHGGSTSPRCTVPLSWTRLEGMVRVVGLDAQGAVHSAEFWFAGPDTIDLGAVLVARTEGGYQAATRTATGKVVAVSSSRIDWLSDTAGRFHVVHSRLDGGLAGTVACFPSTTSEEVLVVSGDGFLSRMAIPRGSRRQRGESPTR